MFVNLCWSRDSNIPKPSLFSLLRQKVSFPKEILRITLDKFAQ
jgi:hypothetical protein